MTKDETISILSDMRAEYNLFGTEDEAVRYHCLSLAIQALKHEKHGHWKLVDKGHDFYDWRCSSCGGSGRGDYNYCPWCGAKMYETDEVTE